MIFCYNHLHMLELRPAHKWQVRQPGLIAQDLTKKAAPQELWATGSFLCFLSGAQRPVTLDECGALAGICRRTSVATLSPISLPLFVETR